MKKSFIKKALPFLGKVLKGAVKSVPFVGNIAVDIVEEVSKKDIATGESKGHDKLVLVIELIGALVLGYLVISGKLPVEDFIEFLQTLIG